MIPSYLPVTLVGRSTENIAELYQQPDMVFDASMQPSSPTQSERAGYSKWPAEEQYEPPQQRVGQATMRSPEGSQISRQPPGGSSRLAENGTSGGMRLASETQGLDHTVTLQELQQSLDRLEGKMDELMVIDFFNPIDVPGKELQLHVHLHLEFKASSFIVHSNY